jgi:DNA mismatch repair protein MutS
MNIDLFYANKNIFKPGIYPDLDNLYNEKEGKMDVYEIVNNKFNEFFRNELKSKRKNDIYVKVEQTTKEKYLKMTETKKKLFDKHQSKLNNYSVNISNKTYLLSEFKLEKKTKSSFKITHNILKYQDVADIDTEIYSLTRKYFLEIMCEYETRYMKMYKNMTKIVAEIDFSYSNAKCAYNNKYIKPEIIEEKEAFFDIENMRHPMIEKICSDIYKPFNLNLNSDKSGLVLSGLNRCGKSCLMKTVGVLMVLAQIGYYVPATKMVYSPFNKIMTRIVGNDNILTNSSSYQVEMIELRNILNRADVNTLVLVDELCRGTEQRSSVSLTVATIKEFSERLNNKFIMTTHLHRIFEFITDINNILIKHISIKEEDGKLIYDRELKDGPSPTNYGLMVAKAMGINIRVLSNAEKISNKLQNINADLITHKKSRYNSSKLVDCCELCGSTDKLETHHKREQKNADERGFFPDGTHMNVKSNLQILCDNCHKNHHKLEKN